MAAPLSEVFPKEQEVPIVDEGPRPFAPAVCLREHWDRSAVLRHVLPSQSVTLPLTFRPYTKVCREYRTTAPALPAPRPPADMVFPPGGEFYPPTRYSDAIDAESSLRTLDQPLRKYCDAGQFLPQLNGDMYSTAPMAPERTQPTSAMVQEMAMPQVCLKAGEYDCRSNADRANWSRSPRLFNNPTKQDRYPAQPRKGAIGITPPKSGLTRDCSQVEGCVWGP